MREYFDPIESMNPFKDPPPEELTETHDDSEEALDAADEPETVLEDAEESPVKKEKSSLEAFKNELLEFMRETNDPHFEDISMDQFNEDDAKYWTLFKHAMQNNPGEFSVNDLEEYRQSVNNESNPSRNTLFGYINNKIFIAWIKAGLVTEVSNGPKRE
jgi:hypothetical protein